MEISKFYSKTCGPCKVLERNLKQTDIVYKDIDVASGEGLALLDKYNINSNNVLFLDDNKDNIETAGEMGINTILVNKNMNIYDEICKYMIKYE